MPNYGLFNLVPYCGFSLIRLIARMKPYIMVLWNSVIYYGVVDFDVTLWFYELRSDIMVLLNLVSYCGFVEFDDIL